MEWNGFYLLGNKGFSKMKRNQFYLLGNKGAHIYNGNIFTCEKCSKSYITQVGLRQHKCYACEKCHKALSRKQQLATHKCGPNISKSCSDCGKNFKAYKNFTEHKCCYCKVCKKTYSDFRRYSEHNCRMLKKSEYQCPDNEKCILTKAVPKGEGHEKVSKPSISESCSDCGKNFKTDRNLTEHKCCYCKVCKKTYSDFRRYIEHNCRMLKKSEYQCPDNEKCILTKAVPKCEGHEKVSKPSISESCSDCGMNFETDRNLTEHKCCYCKVCKKTYSDFRRYSEHNCRMLKKSEDQCPDNEKCILTKAVPKCEGQEKVSKPDISESCSDCGKNFKNITEHKCCYCKVCKKTYSDFQRYSEHNCKVFKKKSEDQCPDNEKCIYTGTGSKYEGHEKIPKLKRCLGCRRFFKNNESFLEHKCYCRYCGKTLSSVTEYSEHNCMLLYSSCNSNTDFSVSNEKNNSRKEKHSSQSFLESSKTSQHRSLCKVSALSAHVDDAFIPDDIICDALDIMRHTQSDRYSVGQVTPAEMHYAVLSERSLSVANSNKICINIHHVSDHWVTSAYTPATDTVTVYDSLKSTERINQLQNQLTILYGLVSKTRYIPIKQQGSQPLCGAFAIAAAFSVFLGLPPETQDFDISKMRNHIKRCIHMRKVIMFPTNDNLLSSYFQTQTTFQAAKQEQSDSRTLSSNKNNNSRDRSTYFRLHMQKQRAKPLFRQKEREKEKNNKRNKRSVSQNQAYEKQCERVLKRKQRSDPQKKEKEREYGRIFKRAKRSIQEKQETERDYGRIFKRAKRSIQEKQEEERDYGRIFKRTKRSDPEKLEKERENDRKYRSNRLSDHVRRKRKRECDRQCKKKQRTDPKKRKEERDNDNEYRRRQRSDLFNRERERQYDSENKRQQRSVPAKRDKEREYDKLRKQSSNSSQTDSSYVEIKQAVALFHKSVEEACEYVCTCCDQLWFRHSVVKALYTRCSDEQLKAQCIRGVKSFDGKEWLCHTCNEAIKKNKIPRLSVANGFRFPKKQPVLELNKLEERLISPVTVFMQIRELPSGKQQSVHGNVVNVPCDNIATLSSLPRLPEQSYTIPLKLKRRLRYKSYVLYENVRPHACMDAVHFLLSKPLFHKYVPDGINREWLRKCSREILFGCCTDTNGK